ncbi:helicase-related protein [Roseateles sp. GG27B]
MFEAGIRPSNKHRQVGDYKLTQLASEGEGFQEWEAVHVSVETIQRRVRIYTLASASTPEARAARLRQARREFEVLDGINHHGILRVNDLKDTELGPALIFDHDPKAVRLDHLLREKGKTLTVTQRLQMVRDIAETLKYAHAKRLYHGALGPQSILVYETGADGGPLLLRLMNWQTAARNPGNVERRQAETAFGEEKNCVIVATSTLELGIDVGDLDRVIQIDSPSTVSSFLQRMGRTGSAREFAELPVPDDQPGRFHVGSGRHAAVVAGLGRGCVTT